MLSVNLEKLLIRRSPRHLYYSLIFLSIILCHFFAGIQFWLNLPELEAPITWINQFYVLLSLSFFLSILLFAYRGEKFLGHALFIAKFVIFVIIGLGEGKYLGVEFTLLTLILIETSAYFNLVKSITLSSVLLLITLLNQQTIKAWDIHLSSVPLHDLISLAIYGGLFSCVVNVLHLAVNNLDRQTQEANRLDKAVSQLMEANVVFQRYATSAREQSADQERKRISRDIHDTAVHTFMTLIILAESAIDSISSENQKLSKILQQMITQAKVAVSDTRHALRELRGIEEVVPKGLQAIIHLVKVFEEATGVQVHLDTGNTPWQFKEGLDQTVYRMVQEGLTNAFRHGKATEVIIRLWIFETSSGPELIVRIRDNGQGSPEINKGIGLQGMEERINKVQGRFESSNVIDGFEIAAWIPFK